jgi:hypothetical protein
MRVIADVPAGNVAFCKPVVRSYRKQKAKLRGKVPTGLNGVNRCVRKWTHGTGYETNNHMLVCRQLGQLWLPSMGKFLQLLIRSEVRACVVVSPCCLHGRMQAHLD